MEIYPGQRLTPRLRNLFTRLINGSYLKLHDSIWLLRVAKGMRL